MFSTQQEIAGRVLSIETGNLANQANGAVVIRYGDTVIMVAAVASKEAKKDLDFFPLICEHKERTYAAGKFPGGFIKREGRSTEKEILTSRLIDRPLRPLFNKDFRNEVAITSTVFSYDGENSSDIISIIGASAALIISDIPFDKPIGVVRIGRINDKFIVNPTLKEQKESSLDLVIAGTNSSIMMIECGASEVSERLILEALEFSQEHIRKIIRLQEDLYQQYHKEKLIFENFTVNKQLKNLVSEFIEPKMRNINSGLTKQEWQKQMESVEKETIERFKDQFPEKEDEIKAIIEENEKVMIRERIIKEEKRPDGRDPKAIRSITCQVGILPRTHGSGLFTRGQTQALVVTTLGTEEDEQIVDSLEGKNRKKFMLHYNFPSYSVGETKPDRGPGRREIGHGALAERALSPLIPNGEVFPYTIRVVSDILESNGSTSMASVCGGTLSLMDAGVPIQRPCSGIAMGLIASQEKIIILSDITGLEDQIGDMDFKVAGTSEGITALQLDVKVEGLSVEMLKGALHQAYEGRLFILGEMNKSIQKSAEKISMYAPRIIKIGINPDKIRDVIGPGGKIIRNIIELTGAKIDIKDKGEVSISSCDEEKANQALEMINCLIAEVEVGKIYQGKVIRITNFGAFVEVLPGKEGLVHISQLANYHVRKVEDILKEGDKVLVKVMEIDEQGRINLSRKAALTDKG
ncbi:polyribonucleotide nucleotidyltransferase [bacterium]|nr:polyribonucleotide nucleotidyltransferase [bacterium]MBU1781970.1 polyribonucleotide nucleotidyltransferase [bacterium]